MPQLSAELIDNILNGTIPLPQEFEEVEEAYAKIISEESQLAIMQSYQEDTPINYQVGEALPKLQQVITLICQKQKKFRLINFSIEMIGIIREFINCNLQSKSILKEIEIKIITKEEDTEIWQRMFMIPRYVQDTNPQELSDQELEEELNDAGFEKEPAQPSCTTLEQALIKPRQIENYIAPSSEEDDYVQIPSTILSEEEQHKNLIEEFEKYFFHTLRQSNYLYMQEATNFPILDNILETPSPSLSKSLTLPKESSKQNTILLIKNYYPMLLEVIRYHQILFNTLKGPSPAKIPLFFSSKKDNSKELNNVRKQLNIAEEWRQKLFAVLSKLQQEMHQLRKSQMLGTSQLSASAILPPRHDPTLFAKPSNFSPSTSSTVIITPQNP